MTNCLTLFYKVDKTGNISGYQLYYISKQIWFFCHDISHDEHFAIICNTNFSRETSQRFFSESNLDIFLLIGIRCDQSFDVKSKSDYTHRKFCVHEIQKCKCIIFLTKYKIIQNTNDKDGYTVSSSSYTVRWEC